MSIRNILVSFDLLSPRTSTLECAAGLADRVGATVSGVAAARPWGELSYAGLGAAAAALLDQQRAEIEEAVTLAEDRFRTEVPRAMQGRFVGLIDAPTARLIETAASTDLIMLPPVAQGSDNENLHPDPGQVVVAAGRPVLVLGEGVRTLPLHQALIAWKDTREARRAVADALPLLQLAEHVEVVSVDEGDYGRERAELESVVAWLASHNVSAGHDVLPLAGSVADVIAEVARTHKSDLVVSGGYGHARLREWLLGGVTRDLLDNPRHSRLMSN